MTQAKLSHVETLLRQRIEQHRSIGSPMPLLLERDNSDPFVRLEEKLDEALSRNRDLANENKMLSGKVIDFESKVKKLKHTARQHVAKIKHLEKAMSRVEEEHALTAHRMQIEHSMERSMMESQLMVSSLSMSIAQGEGEGQQEQHDESFMPMSAFEEKLLEMNQQVAEYKHARNMEVEMLLTEIGELKIELAGQSCFPCA